MEAQHDIWLIESPVVMVEGEQVAYSVDWQGAASVTNPQALAFKSGVDITTDVMDAGDEHIINGSVLTLMRLRARQGDGGARYVLVVEADVDGNRERRKLLIHIVRAHAEG
jgi:hypothetical protein